MIPAPPQPDNTNSLASFPEKGAYYKSGSKSQP
jgi:hypothetical protein